MAEKKYRVIKLLKNRIYPTYQLFATMANGKTAPEDGLRLAALTTMHWLKARLDENAPASWASLPEPSDYLNATEADLPSLYLNQGHVINIVSLPDRGVWTLQITEPDLGSDPGNPEQSRPAVPGRIIETNIAFQIVGSKLEQLNISWQDKLARKNDELEALALQLRRQKEYAASLEGEKAQLREDFSKEQEKNRHEIESYVGAHQCTRFRKHRSAEIEKRKRAR